MKSNLSLAWFRCRRVAVALISVLVVCFLLAGNSAGADSSKAADTTEFKASGIQQNVAATGGAAAGSVIKDALVSWLRKNPVIYPIESNGLGPLTGAVLAALVPVYEIILLLLGMYIIFVALIPQRRAHAKSMFTRLLTGLVLVSLSPMIFQLFLELEDSLIGQIYVTAGFPDTGPPSEDVQAIIALLYITLYPPFTYNLGIVTIVTVLLFPLLLLGRYIAVGMLGALFPMTLFLYSFDYTKSLGAKMMRWSLMWIFVPVVQVVFYLVMFESLHSMANFNLSNLLVGPLFVYASFVLMVAVPLLMTKMMKEVGAQVWHAGVRKRNFMLMSAGGVMMGTGPGAFQQAAFHFVETRSRSGSDDGREVRGRDTTVKPEPRPPGLIVRARSAYRDSRRGGGTWWGAQKEAFVAGLVGSRPLDARQPANSSERWRAWFDKKPGAVRKAGILALALVRLPASAALAPARLGLVATGTWLSSFSGYDQRAMPKGLDNLFGRAGALLTGIGKGDMGVVSSGWRNRPSAGRSLGKWFHGKWKESPWKTGLSVAAAAGFGAAFFLTPVGWGLGAGILLGAGTGVGAGLGSKVLGEGLGASVAVRGGIGKEGHGKGWIKAYLTGDKEAKDALWEVVRNRKEQRRLAKESAARKDVVESLKKKSDELDDKVKETAEEVATKNAADSAFTGPKDVDTVMAQIEEAQEQVSKSLEELRNGNPVDAEANLAAARTMLIAAGFTHGEINKMMGLLDQRGTIDSDTKANETERKNLSAQYNMLRARNEDIQYGRILDPSTGQLTPEAVAFFEGGFNSSLVAKYGKDIKNFARTLDTWTQTGTADNRAEEFDKLSSSPNPHGARTAQISSWEAELVSGVNSSTGLPLTDAEKTELQAAIRYGRLSIASSALATQADRMRSQEMVASEKNVSERDGSGNLTSVAERGMRRYEELQQREVVEARADALPKEGTVAVDPEAGQAAADKIAAEQQKMRGGRIGGDYTGHWDRTRNELATAAAFRSVELTDEQRNDEHVRRAVELFQQGNAPAARAALAASSLAGTGKDDAIYNNYGTASTRIEQAVQARAAAVEYAKAGNWSAHDTSAQDARDLFNKTPAGIGYGDTTIPALSEKDQVQATDAYSFDQGLRAAGSAAGLTSIAAIQDRLDEGSGRLQAIEQAKAQDSTGQVSADMDRIAKGAGWSDLTATEQTALQTGLSGALGYALTSSETQDFLFNRDVFDVTLVGSAKDMADGGRTVDFTAGSESYTSAAGLYGRAQDNEEALVARERATQARAVSNGQAASTVSISEEFAHTQQARSAISIENLLEVPLLGPPSNTFAKAVGYTDLAALQLDTTTDIGRDYHDAMAGDADAKTRLHRRFLHAATEGGAAAGIQSSLVAETGTSVEDVQRALDVRVLESTQTLSPAEAMTGANTRRTLEGAIREREEGREGDNWRMMMEASGNDAATVNGLLDSYAQASAGAAQPGGGAHARRMRDIEVGMQRSFITGKIHYRTTESAADTVTLANIGTAPPGTTMGFDANGGSAPIAPGSYQADLLNRASGAVQGLKTVQKAINRATDLSLEMERRGDRGRDEVDRTRGEYLKIDRRT